MLNGSDSVTLTFSLSSGSQKTTVTTSQNN
jgi:hypothetical protein